MGASAAFYVISAIATAASAYSSYQANKEEKKLLNKQAGMETDAALQREKNVREKGRRLLAMQRAELAGSGVKIDEGSGDALQQETQRLTEQDALAVIKEGANRADLLRQQAHNAGKAATMSLITGFAQTGSKAVSSYRNIQTANQPGINATQLEQDAANLNRTNRNAPRYSLLTGKLSTYRQP